MEHSTPSFLAAWYIPSELCSPSLVEAQHVASQYVACRISQSAAKLLVARHGQRGSGRHASRRVSRGKERNSANEGSFIRLPV